MPERAKPPMVIKMLGSVMEVREKQPLRAQFPMVVRLSGRVREVREELPENLKFADGTEPVGKGDRGEGRAVKESGLAYGSEAIRGGLAYGD